MNTKLLITVACAVSLSSAGTIASAHIGNDSLWDSLNIDESSLVAPKDNSNHLVSQRPKPKDRLFKSVVISGETGGGVGD